MSKRSSSRTAIIFFVFLSILSFALILKNTYSDKTLEALKSVSFFYLIMLALSWALNLLFDSLSLKYLIEGSGGQKIAMRHCVATSVVRIVFNLLTPFSFGGQPFMVYYLKQKGISPGRSTPAVIVKLATIAIFGFIGALAASIIFRIDGLIAHDFPPELHGALTFAIIIAVIFSVLIIAVLLYPQSVTGFFIFLGRIYHKVTRKESTHLLEERILHAAGETRESFMGYFKTHPGHLLLGTFFSLLMYLTDLMMIFYAVKSFSPSLPVLEGFCLSAFVEILLVFLPTPGSAGLGEAVFALTFSLLAPSYILAPAVVVWRFFYSYLSVLIGSVIVAKVFGFNNLNTGTGLTNELP